MDFQTHSPSSLSQAQFLYLTTSGWKSGKNHRIEIWFVEFNNNYYIVSEREHRAHWIRNIRYNPAVKFRLSNKTYEGTARIVDTLKEHELAVRISKLMESKYKWNQGLIVEIMPLNFSDL